MIKELLSAKVTLAASSQFVVFGLKMLDAHAHTLRFLGLFLCATSLTILFYSWHLSTKTEAAAALVPAASAKRTRKQSRSRTSRACRPANNLCWTIQINQLGK